MRRCWRLLFSVFVACCVLFSNLSIVHATETNPIINIEEFEYIDPNSPIILDEEITEDNLSTFGSAYAKCDSNDEYTTISWGNYVTATNVNFVANNTYYFRILQNPSLDISSGKYDLILTLEVPSDFTLTSNITIMLYTRQGASIGSYIESVKTKQGNNYIIQFKDIDLTNDLGQIRLDFYGNFTTGGNVKITPSKYEFKKLDDTEGLLSGIIEWVKGIYHGIVDLPENIASSISGFFTWIVDAVNNMKNAITTALTNLGNFLIDGIKGLFVPTAEDITNMQDDWNTLLEDRFGGLYQTIELIDNYAKTFTNQSKSTITIPSIAIPFGDVDFNFGGWEVQVIPDKFGFLIDVLKTIISILATIMFVNGLKGRFERIIGGSTNA